MWKLKRTWQNYVYQNPFTKKGRFQTEYEDPKIMETEKKTLNFELKRWDTEKKEKKNWVMHLICQKFYKIPNLGMRKRKSRKQKRKKKKENTWFT